MKRLYKALISIHLMSVLLILYAFAMGAATFIENDYGAAVAKHFVYNAWWFELIQFLLAVNMIGNIFKYKLYKKQKLSILTFHLAFIIILIGAGITRYISFEGFMHIREGETNNKILSGNSFLQIDLSKNNKTVHLKKEIFISPKLKSDFKEIFTLEGEKIETKLLNIIPNPKQTIVEVIGGKSIVEIVSPTHGRMVNYFLEDKSTLSICELVFSLNNENSAQNINLFTQKGKLFIESPYKLYTLSMTGSTDSVLQPNVKHEIQLNKLYSIENEKIIVKKIYEKARISYVPGDIKNGIQFFALEFEIKSNDITKKIELLSSFGSVGIPVYSDINGINIKFNYGAAEIKLPFELKLRDFLIDRYPGSESPSSYASEVKLLDKSNNIEMDYRIFMNNVLDYKGYRFFQSSYDKDEKGTILSVNKDKTGTIITYIGYFLLSLGMFLSIFNKNSYFLEIVKKTSEIRNKRKNISKILLILLLFGSQNIYSQNTRQHVDLSHSKVFSKLFVQDNSSRTKPYNTLTNELLRKISRKDNFLGLNSNQVFLGMVFNSEFWKDVKMIKVSNPELKNLLGVEGSYFSFNDLVNLEKNEYKLKFYIDEAFKKDPSQRNKFDKDVIAVDERLNISYQIYSGTYLNVFPVIGDINKKWLSPAENKQIKDSIYQLFVANIFSSYYNELIKSETSGDWTKPNEIIQQISELQTKYASEIIPSETKLNMEIHYTNADIFNRIYKYYGIVGLIFLIVLFVGILKPKMEVKKITIIAIILLSILFLLHTYGLGLRWYVSEHAPWSNGYESMIYIAWATMLAGFMFVKKSPITLAATALLASITLMVAHLSWMDPQITNLVPVLKSYWLTIHVSVITASYGFLALSALLGFLSLILMILKNKRNSENINLTISEITNVNHLALIAGLYMLTIGTFLGGIWANESWGRYWGWDPKETWALISIIIYSFVTHTRLIKSLNNNYAFNLLSLLSFSSVLMTYFGVNYYLSGLHSYASGDAVPIPNFVYVTLCIIVVVSIIAFIQNSKDKKQIEDIIT
ncbi:MAG: cytochrome c biogenesis protein CcsA [Bacteroidales bacterium]|nr:cytochrome c biogenesis protein CcsA [Bacteroidales bacterium]MBN2755899.1 cytochrome c biogenesis protein CcsA [Bacteroidales bacterium]